jgi:acyl-coenzyme A synthetase/AMP-(fatty) acid ligase
VPMLAADQPVLLVLTSGSTGTATATLKCWGELVARTRAAGERFALSERSPDGIVGTVPPHHMYGLETTVLLPLHAACRAWCGPAFYPADVARALAAVHGPSLLVTTPLHLRTLHEADLAARPARVISATAPLAPSLAEAVERDWGAPVLEIFGASEVGSIASRRTVEGEDWALYPGLTLDGTGEAPVVRAPGAGPRPLADVLDLTPAGFRLLGRRADLVKLGGRRASLAGLTRILASVEGVQDAAFMAPDDLEQRRGARLAAFAVAPGRTAAELTRVLRREIEPVFLPRPLVLVDALPRNATGKLPRADLLALLAGATR